jgi:hypothetical protein
LILVLKEIIIETACDLVEIMQLGSVCTSSVNICGQTLCSLFSIGHGGASSIKSDSSNLRLLIIDEISTMIDADTLAMLDARLQQIMGNSKPFGGSACLCWLFYPIGYS